MNWTISQLERTLPDGVVMTAHWRVSQEQDGVYATAYGSMALPAKDPSDPTFVPYDNLTESQVVEWVKEAMGPEQVAAYETSLSSQIAAQLNPVSASGVPWSSPAP